MLSFVFQAIQSWLTPARQSPARRRRLPVEFAQGGEVRPSEAGMLSRFLDLPYELRAKILAHTDPLTLLHLSRSSRSLRASLLCRSALPIWRAAFHNIGLDLTWFGQGKNEADIARLLFTDECMGCGVKTGRKGRVDESWGRTCDDCRVSKSDRLEVRTDRSKEGWADQLNDWRAQSLATQLVASLSLPTDATPDLATFLTLPAFEEHVAGSPYPDAEWRTKAEEVWEELRVVMQEAAEGFAPGFGMELWLECSAHGDRQVPKSAAG